MHCFKLHRSYLISFNLSNVGEIFWGWIRKENRKQSLEKENRIFRVVFTYSVKRACEIRKFHLQLCNDDAKSMIHVQSCCFTNIKLLLFFLFLLLSPSLLPKLPLVIQSFCYHGDVTSHFSSLLISNYLLNLL